VGSNAYCARPPVAGDLLVNEVLVNTSSLCGTPTADWMEVLNVSGDHLNLNGCKLSDLVPATATVNGDLVVTADDLLVMVQKSTGLPLGTTKVWNYGNVPNINIEGDTMDFVCGTKTIFSFTIGGTGIPMSKLIGGYRYAIQLSHVSGVTPTLAQASSADNWCYATQNLTCGDGGTPGLANDLCLLCRGDKPIDCAGVCQGAAYLDSCDVCSSGLSGHVADSDKDCNGDCFGTAALDDCDNCAGGLTGKTPESCTKGQVCYVGACCTPPVLWPGMRRRPVWRLLRWLR
jgi:hypothetical protein